MTGYSELTKFIDQVGVMPGEIRKELRPQLRIAGQPIEAKARRNASWSHRIPGATTVKVSTGKKDPGIFLRVSAAKAPHARPYEGITGRATFRHPVYGNDVWVEQSTRPFLRSAAVEGLDDVVSAADRAVIAAARRAGFR